MIKSRYYTANQDLKSVIKKLDSSGFNRLPDCGDCELLMDKRIIIDVKLKIYWVLDQNNFDKNVSTIRSYLKEALYEYYDQMLDEDYEPEEVAEENVSLRDYFAAKAMQGELASQGSFDLKPNLVAKKAYEIADQMLETRKSNK